MKQPKDSERNACPKCGGRIVEIIYGEPTKELLELSDRKEIILGGCCITIDEKGNPIEHNYGCIDCGENF